MKFMNKRFFKKGLIFFGVILTFALTSCTREEANQFIADRLKLGIVSAGVNDVVPFGSRGKAFLVNLTSGGVTPFNVDVGDATLFAASFVSPTRGIFLGDFGARFFDGTSFQDVAFSPQQNINWRGADLPDPAEGIHYAVGSNLEGSFFGSVEDTSGTIQEIIKTPGALVIQCLNRNKCVVGGLSLFLKILTLTDAGVITDVSNVNLSKFEFNENTDIRSMDWATTANLLVLGFSNGKVGLVQNEDFQNMTFRTINSGQSGSIEGVSIRGNSILVAAIFGGGYLSLNGADFIQIEDGDVKSFEFRDALLLPTIAFLAGFECRFAQATDAEFKVWTQKKLE